MNQALPSPKYSLIVPTRNSLTYLLDCIHSVLDQEFHDYELIISDNHSSDGTFEAIQAMDSEHLRLIRPQEYLAMVDHWEWALGHARGEWVVFLGSDDGVLPYFFRLAEGLTALADQHNIPVIGSARAYFFWPGCQSGFGNLAIQYRAYPSCRIRSTKRAIVDALLGTRTYLELPQMYTSSLVHRSLIARAKEKQHGLFFSAQTPDASGAAIICSLADHYLECAIPLGWVGTSPKSNGMAYTNNKDDYQKAYFRNMLPQRIRWNETMGKFNPVDGDRTIDNMRAFFFEALLQAQAVIGDRWNRIYHSRTFKTVLFSRIMSEIRHHKTDKTRQLQCLKDVVATNGVSYTAVTLLSALSFVIRTLKIPSAVVKRWRGMRGLTCKRYYEDGDATTLTDASAVIADLDKQKRFTEKFIRRFEI